MDELEVLRAIVRDLAALDSRTFEMQHDHGNPACVICNWGRDGSNEGKQHAPDCIYSRAVAATKKP